MTRFMQARNTRDAVSEALPGPAVVRRPIPVSILVVDDEPLIRETLAEYLSQEGFQVVTCAEGEEALALAAKKCFDVALCDLHMPGIDGMELLERQLTISPH